MRYTVKDRPIIHTVVGNKYRIDLVPDGANARSRCS